MITVTHWQHFLIHNKLLSPQIKHLVSDEAPCVMLSWLAGSAPLMANFKLDQARKVHVFTINELKACSYRRLFHQAVSC